MDVPNLGNHVNLLFVCFFFFMFVFGLVCTTNWYPSIKEAKTLEKHVF
jgi:hypothetical protein